MKTGMMAFIAKSRTVKRFSAVLALIMFFELGLPTVSWALTSGPGQPEYSSFEPASTTDMVNLYDGSFTYNIPLLTVPGPNGGYPINLAYHANPGMEEEASWVGLGWSLNVGAINRQLQGIPDDFNGDQIRYDYHMKKNWSLTAGTSFGGNAHSEEFGYPISPEPFSNALNTQIYFNNYKGLGYRVSGNIIPPGTNTESAELGDFAALDLSLDSQNGIGIAPSLHTMKNFKVGINASYNNRTGLNQVGFATDYGLSNAVKKVTGKIFQKILSRASENKTDAIRSVQEGIQYLNTRASVGISFNFGGQVPSVQMPMHHTNWSCDLRVVGVAGQFRSNETTPVETTAPFGFQVYPFFHQGNPYEPIATNWFLSYNESVVDGDDIEKSAIGYLYHNFSNSQVQDYAKQTLEFNKKMPNLGASKQTFDVFTFSGQGTGGFFRAYSNSIDLLSQASETATTGNNHVTAELGIPAPPPATPPTTSPPPLHIGGGYNHGEGTNITGGWQSGITGLEDLGTDRNEAKQKLFRLHGEPSPVLLSDEKLDDWIDNAAIKNKLDHSAGYYGRTYNTTSDYVTNDGATPFSPNSDMLQKRGQRDKRNTSVKYVPYNTAHDFGYSKLDTYWDSETSAEKDKFDDTRPNNHISEVVVTQTDGVKYLYGRPVYNNTQIEATQSCAGTGFSPNSPYANISSSSYTSGAFHQYNEELLNKTTSPAYAYSWLLSGIMGSDYIDDDGVDGISEGDKGYWIKFSYTRAHSAYKWRIPYTGAHIIERRNGRDEDNLGTFTYGTKEIFYLNKAETATHVAVFETGCRRDGIAAEEEYATGASLSDNDKQYYLKKITLYTRPDYEAHISDLSGATPVVTVNFRYDYQLCKNLPNYSDGTCDNDDVYDAESNPDGHIFDAAGDGDNGGKLTLREVYFTYEKSTKAALSPYRFYYSPTGDAATGAYNPDYDINAIDRWGSFKNNAGAGYGSNYEYGRFSYTEQRMDENGILEDTDMQTAKWSLHRVKLPTGGTLSVNYEPNDYAYEEAEKPMHMYDIVGIGNDVDGTDEALKNTRIGSAHKAWYELDGSNDPNEIGSALTESPDRFSSSSTKAMANLDEDHNDAFKVFFKLDKPYSTSLSAADRNAVIKSQYVGELKRLWFKNKTLMSGINNLLDSKGQFEYVEGYASLDLNKIDDANYFGMCREVGLSSGSPFTIGYITLQKKPIRENDHGIIKGNEMQKLALQVLKLERDDVGYAPAFVGPSTASGTLTAALGFVSDVLVMLTEIRSLLLSYNVEKKAKKHCKYIALNGNSKIKLYDDDQRKYGAGYRVKEIRLNDNWRNDEGSGTNNAKSEYGQKYVYTMDSKSGGISSGVCYEPFQGKEESALRKPVDYEKSTFLSYHQEMFVEKPIMDAYYPGASLGYRKVTTYSLSRDVASEQITATSSTGDVNYSASAPVSVTEFYTPKEFPVQVDETNIDVEAPYIIPINVPGIYSYLEAKKAASQGYAIVLNDMAGKLKRMSTHRWLPPADVDDIGAVGNTISSTEYLYQTAGIYNENGSNALDNTVQLAINDHQYQTGNMNVYYDMFVEHNESSYQENDFGVQANFDYYSPAFTLSLFPSGSETDMSQKTVVTHKVVYRSGILNKVVATTDQSVVTSETLMFDSETGAPVLTRTNNNFDDPIYTLQQPAHWYYGNTGSMYRNDYLTLSGSYSMDANSWVTLASSPVADGYDNAANFAEGDQVIITRSGVQSLVTVAAVDVTNHAINLMDENGESIGSGTITNIYMLQSGRKNFLGLNVGAVTAMSCDISDFTTVQTSPTSFALSNYLDASAITLGDDWQMDCCSAHIPEGKHTFNPFLTGSRNMWRVKSNYGYNTERVYNNNSRTDGIFKTFAMFDWTNPDGDANWVKAGQTTAYSPFGFEAETKDALGNFSSARYGYGNILPVAIASNSHYADMDFEGFEYVNPTECITPKELFGGDYSGLLVAGKAHSGTYGMRVQGTPYEFDFTVKSAYPCTSGVSHHYTLGETLDEVEYDKDECDCFGNSFLIAGITDKPKQYIFSAWARETGWANKPTSFTAPQIDVTITVSGTPTTVTKSLLSSDKIVEGWQRFFFEIDVPVNATAVSIKLKNNSYLTRDVYFDDLRIHPIESNMMSYVYDAINFKLKAELDANNFATFYSYDEEGNLINTKKETTRGVKTITEGRKELQKRGL